MLKMICCIPNLCRQKLCKLIFSGVSPNDLSILHLCVMIAWWTVSSWVWYEAILSKYHPKTCSARIATTFFFWYNQLAAVSGDIQHMSCPKITGKTSWFPFHHDSPFLTCLKIVPPKSHSTSSFIPWNQIILQHHVWSIYHGIFQLVGGIPWYTYPSEKYEWIRQWAGRMTFHIWNGKNQTMFETTNQPGISMVYPISL